MLRCVSVAEMASELNLEVMPHQKGEYLKEIIDIVTTGLTNRLLENERKVTELEESLTGLRWVDFEHNFFSILRPI